MKNLKIKLALAVVIFLALILGFAFTYNLRNKQLVEKPKVENNTKVDTKLEEQKKPYETPEDEKKRLKEEFDALKKINNETVGHIFIPGTQLDEPIVQTSDNSTYLNKTFEGENIPFMGAVFIDYENNSDFKDPLTWLFGHARGSKVEDRRMFNDVNFFEDQKFMDEHPYVVIETPNEVNYYTVEFLVRVSEDTDLYRLTFNGFDDFNQQIKKAASMATIKAKNAKMEGTSEYIVLSTCREDDTTLRTNLYCRKISDYDKENFIKENKEKIKYVKIR